MRLRYFFIYLLLPLILTQDFLTALDHYIVVEKKNVVHKFAPFDANIDNWVSLSFVDWENDLFDQFEEVKDKNGIAIDLGAWIGTTAIWLSKNFHHVIAVEADRVSIECLQGNLVASECTNVSLCRQPITRTIQNVIFGPRDQYLLNQSVSTTKTQINNPNDYYVTSISLQELIDTYVYANQEIRSHKITFIKCDIEGGEEDILSDILEFCLTNKASAHISFHIGWWNTPKKIGDFKGIFEKFKVTYPSNHEISNVSDFLVQHPFAAMLFEPLD